MLQNTYNIKGIKCQIWKWSGYIFYFAMLLILFLPYRNGSVTLWGGFNLTAEYSFVVHVLYCCDLDHLSVCSWQILPLYRLKAGFVGTISLNVIDFKLIAKLIPWSSLMIYYHCHICTYIVCDVHTYSRLGTHLQALSWTACEIFHFLIFFCWGKSPKIHIYVT